MRLRSTIRGVNTIVVESKQNRVFCGRCCCCWRWREVNWTMRPRNRRPLPRDACAAWRRRWRHWWRQRWRRCHHRLASAAAAAAASAQHLCTSLVADWQVLSDPQLRHVHSNVGHFPRTSGPWKQTSPAFRHWGTRPSRLSTIYFFLFLFGAICVTAVCINVKYLQDFAYHGT